MSINLTDINTNCVHKKTEKKPSLLSMANNDANINGINYNHSPISKSDPSFSTNDSECNTQSVDTDIT